MDRRRAGSLVPRPGADPSPPAPVASIPNQVGGPSTIKNVHLIFLCATRCPERSIHPDGRTQVLANLDTVVAAASRQLQRARRVVAKTLLPEAASREPLERPVPAWQAWLLVTWMTVAAGIYIAMLVGWWR